MAIKFKGKLLNVNQLNSVDTSEYHKIKLGIIDYMIIIFIMIFPILTSLKLLMSPYSGSITSLLVADAIGIMVVIVLVFVHEFFHAITFSKDEDVTIWYKGLMMQTYCTEEKKPLAFIYTLLLPNIMITIPVIIISIILSLFCEGSSLYIKVYGLISSIIVLGSFNDFLMAIFIFRNNGRIKKVRVNNESIYYTQ